jgi:hypothetical protein
VKLVAMTKVHHNQQLLVLKEKVQDQVVQLLKVVQELLVVKDQVRDQDLPVLGMEVVEMEVVEMEVMGVKVLSVTFCLTYWNMVSQIALIIVGPHALA